MAQSELVIADSASLTNEENARADLLDATVQESSESLWKALMEIRDDRLYRKWFGTFEDYCQSRLGKGRRYINYQIRAVDVVERLGTIVPKLPLPEGELQVRPLTRLRPDQQVGAWIEALGRSEGHPTARVIAEVVREMRADIDDESDPPMELEQVADQFPGELTETDKELLETSTPNVSWINPGLFTKENKEWYTPPHIIERVIRVFGQIDLDPCSNSHEAPNVPAFQHYTWEDDGVNQPWHGRVYMNPPYGDEIGQWTERLWRAYEDSEIAEAIALLPSRTDTKWFEPLYNYALCFVRGRLKFSNAENSAPFPSVVVYLGRDVEGFKEHFGGIGRCGLLQ